MRDIGDARIEIRETRNELEEPHRASRENPSPALIAMAVVSALAIGIAVWSFQRNVSPVTNVESGGGAGVRSPSTDGRESFQPFDLLSEDQRGRLFEQKSRSGLSQS